jgi:hypothetical protein
LSTATDTASLCSSGACVTGAAFTDLTKTTFVDLSIAIVVQSVADLGGRERLALASALVNVLASGIFRAILYARSAWANVRGSSGSTVAETCRTGGTACTVVIDQAVAIVIEAIADLRFGRDLAFAGSPCVAEGGLSLADLYTASASARAFAHGGACVAGSEGIGDAFAAIVIDLSVAIVILTIADLRGGCDLAIAAAKAVLAGGRIGDADLEATPTTTFVGGSFCARVAKACITGDTACTTFIDLTIAIVIETIADLILRGDLAFASAKSVALEGIVVGATLCACFTEADIAGSSGAFVTRARGIG